jgi:hypothetical protein
MGKKSSFPRHRRDRCALRRDFPSRPCL